MRPLSGKDVCKTLSQQGFIEKQRKGSHILMQKLYEGGTITVPVPDHTELKPGTLASIIGQSKVARSSFE